MPTERKEKKKVDKEIPNFFIWASQHRPYLSMIHYCFPRCRHVCVMHTHVRDTVLHVYSSVSSSLYVHTFTNLSLLCMYL